MEKNLSLLILLFILFGFKTKKSDETYVCIKGTAINLYTKKPLIKTEITFDEDEINPASYEKVKTDSKGKFMINYFDNNKLQFWLGIDEFAQIKFINVKIDTGKMRDTINLDTVYFVPYFNELKKERYNMPELKKRKINKECFTLKEIDSIFLKDEKLYSMKINSVDTIDGEMTRCSYYYKKSFFHKKESRRGAIISNYKVLTFIRALK